MATTQVSIIDVSMRDGIQNEAVLIPLHQRLEIIDQLLAAGVKSLQIASFVHPTRVPQMADVEALVAQLPAADGVAYSGLVLNTKGLSRLLASGLGHVDLSLSCSEAHSRSNTGLSLPAALTQTIAMVHTAKTAGLAVRVGLQCAFGCNISGAIPANHVAALARELTAAGCDAIALADSTGQAVPNDIKNMIFAVREWSNLPLILHLHDTRGLAIANLLAGYQVGVRAFDASLGGVGGCNFIPGATGNIAIEDVVHLFDRMGVTTGIALADLLPATRSLERTLGYPLPGKVYQLHNKARTAPGAHEPSAGVSAWA